MLRELLHVVRYKDSENILGLKTVTSVGNGTVG